MKKLAFVMAVLLGAPALATSQDRIGPAESIRVIELTESATSRPTRYVAEDLTPAEILRLQIELDRVGYDPHSRSGVLDEATRRALSRFQTARGLEICGCVTYETVVALGITPKVMTRVQGSTSTAYGYDRSSTYASSTYYERTVPVVIIVPSHRHHDRRFTGPGVVVGHEPAIGSGQFHRRPSRPERVPLPPIGIQPGTGSRIRSGDQSDASSGSGIRSSRPRP
jgi:peptidoglycan hydrolase-like protein with peptidoglycan-binding domain